MKGGKKLKTKMENNFWKTFSIILIVVLVVGAVIVFWKNPELSPNAGVINNNSIFTPDFAFIDY